MTRLLATIYEAPVILVLRLGSAAPSLCRVSWLAYVAVSGVRVIVRLVISTKELTRALSSKQCGTRPASVIAAVSL